MADDQDWDVVRERLAEQIERNENPDSELEDMFKPPVETREQVYALICRINEEMQRFGPKRRLKELEKQHGPFSQEHVLPDVKYVVHKPSARLLMFANGSLYTGRR
ncbi:hypothetical protein HN592_03155 [Candidatus Woesearchaeota archaeon]|jgi:hypothetical protein|nr:hypothetical protein [Candidatus Woesearchaeota archaeon]MBT4368211.1 hypothetical protein [Candidatus Woesearchaeota archaeon]MBT4712700.1 hypothetical protein [Candidatus Woesearchaeota archaeon]MBT6639612.1 hypothetical protein [Candidatus Woesearchaeota archaeon]MBT7133784.1 hypothetical protein [Candidatus Woesearchaeota archaeon]